MKFTSIVTTMVLTTPFWHHDMIPHVTASHIVSGSNARLPMSLSSVINDLEAEGASRITTVAFLTSRGITRQKRNVLFHRLFGTLTTTTSSTSSTTATSAKEQQGQGQGHENIIIDQEKTTAFGKKMGNEEDETSDDGGEEEEDANVDANGDTTTASLSVGIAVANPLPNASITEVASTVLACGGNIVFVASLEDLSRGEGLFDKLAPAMEKILNESSSSSSADASSSSASTGLLTKNNNNNTASTTTTTGSSNPLAAIAGAVLPSDPPKPPAPRTLIVVVEGALTEQDLLQAKTKLEQAATNALSSIVQNNKPRAYTLEQVFDNVEYVSSNGGPIDELIYDLSPLLSCDPATAASNVAKAVFQDSNMSLTSGGTLHNSPMDLAAARKLLPLSRKAVEDCLSTVRARTGSSGEKMTLVADFGSLCDAAVQKAMDEFDAQAGKTLLEKSQVGKRIRSELVEEMYSDLESQYEEQLKLLSLACMESFKRDLSQLRLSPNLDKDMEKVAQNAVQLFVNKAKGLRSTKSKAIFWPKGDAQAAKLKKDLKEYVTLRLQTARADGKYRPVPRKGVTVGMHWLLPKPFGNDYRLEPWEVHAKDDLIYVPKDKITDVRKEDVVTGDWRNAIVPAPTANEMIYLK